ncbi:MAG: protocatechuate 3,4-dioxygenase [Gammaproteobacteria bacterium]|nr:protocatechuate 3,4-dioxygenase [Gammaproteobacteria bacterium]
MDKRIRFSRRAVTKHIGVAAGITLLGPGMARAALVTPAQVEGPFHPIDEQADTDLDLTLIDGHSRTATGEVILVRGQVVDTDGRPMQGALVDVWQANHVGRYSHPADQNTAPLDPDFQGWGLIKTDADGRYGFKTIKPGAYPLPMVGGQGWRCKHIHFKVIRAGGEDLTTQMYFRGDPLIEQDLEVKKVPEDLRHLLIADAVADDATGLPFYQFDLVVAKA